MYYNLHAKHLIEWSTCMFLQTNNPNSEDINSIHQYYMEIINSIPHVIYWMDTKCILKGCNNLFIQLLGVDSVNVLQGSPYRLMEQYANWNKERIEKLKLDDMSVLFSGEPQYNINEEPIEDAKGKNYFFQSSRVLMYNQNKEIIGLIVILKEISLNKETKSVKEVQSESKRKIKPKLQVKHAPAVLMVEDNIIAQNVEKALLTALHCHVDIAGSADAAIKLFHPGKYDLVLMDIGLEDSSGYIVAKKLRLKEENTKHHVPIIALTGYEADVVKYDCQHYFMEGVISKPLTYEQADQIIKHYIYHMDVPVRGLKTI